MTIKNKKTGLIKTYWSDVRERVHLIEPQFAKIVDSLAPDNSFPLYLAYYPYGAMDADTQSSLFPNGDGTYFRLTDAGVSKDIQKNLGYSSNNTPLGMVLDKEIESYIDIKSKGITIPWLIYTPGKIFPFTRCLSQKDKRVYSPNGLLSSTAGARSVFMLPNIGCSTKHTALQREFNVRESAPKSLYSQWNIFKEIANSPVSKSDWRCCVMYFSEKWLQKIHTDKAWLRLKNYLHETAWHQFEFEINRNQYDIIFSMIQNTRNLKPNPYLTDTAKHLFTTAVGAAPGYVPATSNNSLPLDAIQKAFVECYGLKKYIPTIMHASHFNFENDKNPIYYSLQNPSTHVFSPKSREVSSTLVDMRELEHIMKIFLSELSNGYSMCHDTIMGKIANELKLNFYHNKVDRHGIIKSSNDILKYDKRFLEQNNKIIAPNASFASDAPFIRGCISISRND